MSQQQTFPPAFAGFENMSDIARQSLETMSGAFSTWLHDAGRMQAEAIRFLSDRFNKDVQLIAEFSQCKRPEDVIAVQTRLVNDLVSDYMSESKTMFSLLGEASKHGLEIAQRAVPKTTVAGES